MPKSLVTGGAGFIGSHVVDALLDRGHQVVVIDNLSTGSVENVNSKAEFLKLDIESAAIEKLFRDHSFDYVYHLAAQMNVRASVEDPAFDARVNILGSLNILSAAQKTGVKKIIFSSTGGAIYGEQDYFPADEEHPTRPVCPYGVSKLTFEKYLYYYNWEYKIDYVALRYANVYGPRQSPWGEAGVIAIFFGRLLTGKDAVIYGDGKKTRDFVYVSDVVRANMMALDMEGSDVFNIGTGSETDINTIFRYCRDFSGSDQDEIHGPEKPGEQLRSCISYKKIEGKLGWKPAVSLDEGMKLTAGFFKQKYSGGQ